MPGTRLLARVFKDPGVLIVDVPGPLTWLQIVEIILLLPAASVPLRVTELAGWAIV
jgi:hypothetical protein